MKAVTANRLSDGAVIWLGEGDRLVERLADAVLYTDEEAKGALARLSAQTTRVAGAYLIEAEAAGPVGREALRETIRANGPTVRPDLGKQAEVRDGRL